MVPLLFLKLPVPLGSDGSCTLHRHPVTEFLRSSLHPKRRLSTPCTHMRLPSILVNIICCTGTRSINCRVCLFVCSTSLARGQEPLAPTGRFLACFWRKNWLANRLP